MILKFVIAKPFRRPIAEPVTVSGGGGGSRTVGLTDGDLGDAITEHYDLSDLVLKRSTEADKIEELMDRYPETVAQILRTWIAEDN